MSRFEVLLAKAACTARWQHAIADDVIVGETAPVRGRTKQLRAAVEDFAAA